MRRIPSSMLRRQHSRGLSLIELMISITIGLILVVAILAAYQGTSGASRVAEAQGRMNEDANAALAILSQQIRMAGYNPVQPGYPNAAPKNPVFTSAFWPIVGCDGNFNNIDTATGSDTLNCTAGGSDSLVVRYEADRYNTINSGGAATDCLGNALLTLGGGTATYSVAENHFFIATSNVISSPSLYCQPARNASKQPLVENIEGMQFIYGTAPATTTTMSVAGYLNASEILAEPNFAPLPEKGWEKVMTVRICVLVRSEAPVAPDADSTKYMSCPSSSSSVGTLTTPTDPNDRRLRRAYSTTVVLRNRVEP